MEHYIQAKEIGEPTSGYSEEVAMGYYNIFGNQIYFHGIFWYLEPLRA